MGTLCGACVCVQYLFMYVNSLCSSIYGLTIIEFIIITMLYILYCIHDNKMATIILFPFPAHKKLMMDRQLSVIPA